MMPKKERGADSRCAKLRGLGKQRCLMMPATLEEEVAPQSSPLCLHFNG